MKLVIHSFLLLCFLFLSGGSQAYARSGQDVGANRKNGVSAFANRYHAIVSTPLQSRKGAHILAILEDCEDREEEKELLADKKLGAGVAHGALYARPRAPGSNVHGNSPARFYKHFAWSSVDKLIVIQVFRV